MKEAVAKEDDIPNDGTQSCSLSSINVGIHTILKKEIKAIIGSIHEF